jgi:hypothetical protein
MNQTERRRFWIDNVNRATIGDINAQHDSTLIGDDAVAGGEFTARRAVAIAIDDCDFVVVNLLGSQQGPIAHADCVANFAMRGFQPLQHFGLIVRNVDAGNSLRESVTTDFARAQRGKLLEGKLHRFRSSKSQNTKHK